MRIWKERVRRGVQLLAMTLLLLTAAFVVLPQDADAATKIKGIDVSKWQGTVDWESVADDGIKFVMLGTGWYKNGTQTYDTKFTTNIQGGARRGYQCRCLSSDLFDDGRGDARGSLSGAGSDRRVQDFLSGGA